MAEPVHLTLPYPPSANRLWRYVNGRAIKSSEYRLWLQVAGLQAMAQRPGRVEGRYRLIIVATPPDRRRRDIDNLPKAASDLLVQVGVIRDDCLAKSVSAEWSDHPIKGGFLNLTILPFDPATEEACA